MMKKTNIVIAILAVVCCASIIVAGFALHFGLYAKENIIELYTCYTLNKERIDGILSKETDDDEFEFEFEFGPNSNTVWTDDSVVRKGKVSIVDGLRTAAYIEIISMVNMEMTAPNYYSIATPTEPAYVLVQNTTTGVIALLEVVLI